MKDYATDQSSKLEIHLATIIRSNKIKGFTKKDRSNVNNNGVIKKLKIMIT